MTPEEQKELLSAITSLVDGLRADMTKHGEEMTAKYDACMQKMDSVGMRRKKADEDDDDPAHPTAAQRTAADAVDPAAFASLASSVAELKKRQSRPMADLNAFADAQAKADAVMRTHNERAEPPMAGEDIVAYQIRMHRKMQKHSPKWKGVELSIIAADRQAFENVLGEIRSDAMQAGLNPTDTPLFEHRAITQESPGGHRITTFHGRGTIFKQMSRPVRHVAFIGTRSTAHH